MKRLTSAIFLTSIFILGFQVLISKNLDQTILLAAAVIMIILFKQKKKLYKLLNEKNKLFYFLLTLLAIFLLYNGGLFSQEFSVSDDFSINFYRSLVEYEFLQDHEFMGFNQQFHAGYYVFNNYFFTFFSYVSLFFFLFGIEPIVFQSVYALMLIIPLFTIYALSKKLGLNKPYRFLASLFWLLTPHYLFSKGEFVYFALNLGLLATYLYLRDDKKSHYLSSLFMGLTLISHPIVFSAFLPLFLLMKKPKKYILYSLVFLLVFLPQIGLFEQGWGVRGAPESELSENSPLKQMFLVEFLFNSFPIFLIPFLLVFTKKDKPIIWFALITIFLIIFIFYSNGDLVNIFRISKFVDVLKVFLIIGTFLFFQKLEVKTRAQRISSSLLTLFVVSFALSNTVYLTLAWDDANHPFYGFWYKDNLSNTFSLPVTKMLAVHAREDTQELLDWLSIPSPDSRTLVEVSSNFMMGGEPTYSLSYTTENQFIGPPYFLTQTPNKISTSAFDGKIFGKEVSDLTYQEFHEHLENFNIERIVAWSQEFKDYLKKDSGLTQIYPLDNDFYSVFIYENCPESFAESKTLVSLKSWKPITLQVDSDKNFTLILKSHYAPQFHAFVEGEEILITETEDYEFMSVNAPAGKYSITISWKSSTWEEISKYSFLLLPMLFLFLAFKSGF